MKATNERGNISITFSREESIVFLEWLHRFNEVQHSSLLEDQAEERILFDLEAELERTVSETFEADYQEILLKARESIRDRE